MRLNSVISCGVCGANVESDLYALVCIVPPGKREPGRIAVFHPGCSRSWAPRADYAAPLAQFSKDVRERRVLADAVFRGSITDGQAREFLSRLYRDPNPDFLQLTAPAKQELLDEVTATDEGWVLDEDLDAGRPVA